MTLWLCRAVEEDSGSVAEVSETTLKRVVIKACGGREMKPSEIEYFKKKLAPESHSPTSTLLQPHAVSASR